MGRLSIPAAWLADYLFNQGLPINSRETVGDSLSALIEVPTERSQVADVLIVNGGLWLSRIKVEGFELADRASNYYGGFAGKQEGTP